MSSETGCCPDSNCQGDSAPCNDMRLWWREEDGKYKVARPRFNLHSQDLDALYVDVTDKPHHVASYLTLAPYLAQEWQGIESAPENKEVLITGGTFHYTGSTYTSESPFDGVEMARYVDGRWEGPYGSEYDELYIHKPTHWQPLPKPSAGRGE